MKWKIVVPVFLMGIGFVVWANFGKEDNSKYIVQEIEVQNTKQPELKKLVKATLDLHKKKKNKTLECIFAATRLVFVIVKICVAKMLYVNDM